MPVTIGFVRDVLKGVVKDHLKEAEDAFTKLDSRGTQDGFITREDMGNDRAIAGIARLYDTDGDGKVSKDEFMAVKLNKYLEKKLNLQEADVSGIEGRFEVGDFRSLCELYGEIPEELRKENQFPNCDLKPEDDDILATILLKMKTDDTSISYSLFKSNLVDMYMDTRNNRGEVKELLDICRTQLGPNEEQVTKEWPGLISTEEKFVTFVKDPDYKEMAGLNTIFSKDVKADPEKYVTDSTVVKARTMGARMDKQFEKATGSSDHTLVNLDLMSKFLNGNGVQCAPSAVEKTFNLMVSVSYPDFFRGLVKFIRNQLF